MLSSSSSDDDDIDIDHIDNSASPSASTIVLRALVASVRRRVTRRDATIAALKASHAASEAAWEARLQKAQASANMTLSVDNGDADMSGTGTVERRRSWISKQKLNSMSIEIEAVHLTDIVAGVDTTVTPIVIPCPSPVRPSRLPLRPLLSYSDDSPFSRLAEHDLASNVQALSTRLKRLSTKSSAFSLAVSRMAQSADELAEDCGENWDNVEGAVEGTLMKQIAKQLELDGNSFAPSPSSSPNSSSSSSSSASDNVSLASAFGRISSMLHTVGDIGSNLSASVDAFLVAALDDFRKTHIQKLFELDVQRVKSQESYESAVVKRLNRKREKLPVGPAATVTDKVRKRIAADEDEFRLQTRTCSALRRSYELHRFDYVSMLNNVMLERRMELIEMICASTLSFTTFFHEGMFVCDSIKLQVDQLSRSINRRRPMYHKSDVGIREQRMAVESALGDVASASFASSSSSAAAAAASPVGSPSAIADAILERSLDWQVRDSFPSRYTASGLMSPAVIEQQRESIAAAEADSPSQTSGSSPFVPSAYAHVSIRGRSVPIEKDGWLRKQSSSFKKDWKPRWFMLQDGQLSYVRSLTDTTPVHVQAVLLCTVRLPSSSELPLCFELISPNKRVYTLQAFTESARAAWMHVFQNCSEALLNASGSTLTASESLMSSHDLKVYTNAKSAAMAAIRALNPTCADCGAPDPDWASINLGIVICIECSGTHRSMGVSVSKVRSLALDSWSIELMDMMKAIGNKRFNALYEGALVTNTDAQDKAPSMVSSSSSSSLPLPSSTPSTSRPHSRSPSPSPSPSLSSPHLSSSSPSSSLKPHPHSRRDHREDFILLKYKARAYICKRVLANASSDQRQHIAELIKAAKDDNIIGMMEAISVGANIDDTMNEGRRREGSVIVVDSPKSSQSTTVSISTIDVNDISFSSSSLSPSSVPSSSPPPSFSSSSSSSSSSSLPLLPGTRCLHTAARFDRCLALEYALQNGARESILDEDGRTALQVAIASGSERCRIRLQTRR